MGLDNMPSYVTLVRCEEDLIIKTCSLTDEIPETLYRFQLSSFFTLLEDGKFTNSPPGLSKITSLDLSNCDLSELPKCIKILGLKTLNLSHNNLTQVPSCLFNNGLKNLENFDISHNKLKHFDVEPDCVLTLKRLKLNNNYLENAPKWFLTFRCTNLEEFDYSDNKASHYEFLKNSCNINYMKLKKLKLQNSCLLDIDIPLFKCYKSLRYLDISNKSASDKRCVNKFNQLEQMFVKPYWKSIEVLKLDFLDISIFPDGLFWLLSLKELHISNNFVSWFPDGLKYLSSLEKLDISNNQLVFIPEQILELTKLKHLLASRNKIEELPVMPSSLEVLDLYDNDIMLVADTKNVLSIEVLDLEINYVFWEKELGESYETYSKKRDLFRELYSKNNRFLGAKVKEEYQSSSNSSYSGKSEDFEPHSFHMENYNDNVVHEIVVTPDEDWDRELIKTPVYKHPDISLSDHEYDGEKEAVIRKNVMSENYLEDEDYIFVDAD